MGKPTICIGVNKDADQLRGNREADHAFVFATRILQFLFYLNPKFQASSSFLCLYRLVCVGPVHKPHCWFSHKVAQIIMGYHLVVDDGFLNAVAAMQTTHSTSYMNRSTPHPNTVLST